MGNCLVTKLKGSVNNDSLPILGEMRIKVLSGYNDDNRQIRLFVDSQKDLVAKVVKGSGTITNLESGASGQTVTIYAGTSPYIQFSNGDFEVSVTDRYNINGLGYKPGTDNEAKGYSIDASQLTYVGGHWYLGGNKFYGDWNGDYSKLAGIYCTDVSEMPTWHLDRCKFENLVSFNLSSKVAEGSIMAFANCVNLASIKCFMAGLTGDVASLAAALWSKGKTSGTLEWVGSISGVTYNGQPLASDTFYVDFTPSGYSLRY